uniref:Transmembrane protein n=1 Tax=Loa loa TaxID=7209 RepID=A0A1I7VM90_LOALO
MSLVEQLMSGSDRWVALQFAFYNTLLLALTGMCLTGLYAVYKMMYMFLTPLLWATLIGTILFPFKKRFNSAINAWLSRVDNDETPLLVAVVLIPYDTFISATDLFLIYLARREGIMILGAYLVLKVLNYITFVALLHLLGDLYQNTDHIILFCTRTWVSILMMLYLAAFVGWLYVQEQHSINKKLARLISLPLWFFGIAKVSSFFGPFNVIVMSGISATLITVAAGILTWEEVKADPEKAGDISSKEAEQKPAEDNKEKTLDQELTGDFYLQAILGLCALEFAVRHDFVPVCVLFLAVFTVLRRIGVEIGVQTGLTKKCCAIWEQFHEITKQFVHVTVAGPLRNYFKFIFSSDQMMKNSLRRAVDDFSTVLVMLLLIFGSLFVTVLVAFQVHGEVAHLSRLGANLLAQQPDWMLDYARGYTGNQLEKSDIDNYVEQGYLKGREWLAANVRSFIGTQDPVKGELLEKEVIELLDKLYGMWGDRNETSISSSDSATKDWMSNLEVFTSISTLREEMVELIKANVDTIMSIAQSVWSFTAGNISTLGTVLFTILAIVINFGLELFNFFIEITVFLTTLYYLLASSQDIWLPTKWLSDTLPPSHDTTGSARLYIIPAIEKAISGVFVLSAKMSLFYEQILDISNENSVEFQLLAAVFASVPVIAPCFVCIFGFLELYLAEHETAAALLFLLTSLAPKVFADTAFYNELRGSHPYVTGLAIIGGIYWLGLQGAIIGPILLCSMIVLLNVYKKFACA